MFRFTIRDLLLLTLIVALAVGCWIRERHWRVEASQAIRWRARAGALEKAFGELGFVVEWDASTVTVWNENDRADNVWVATDRFAPSVKD